MAFFSVLTVSKSQLKDISGKTFSSFFTIRKQRQFV
jgi:hypothetical protein